jgi:tetratricopeptide (TPR) repeat protein
MTADIEALRNAASEAELRGDWQEADRLLQVLRSEVELDSDLLSRHAHVIFSMGDKARAATMMRRAVRNSPGDPKLKLQLGKIYAVQERFQAAEDQFRKVIAVDPENTEAKRRLALALQKKGEGGEEAEVLVKEVVAATPDDLQAWLQLGALYANQESRYKEAETAFARALEIDPISPSALHNYGLLKRFQGDLVEAEKYLKKAFEEYPDQSDFAFSLGICYMYQENAEKALECFEQSIALDPSKKPPRVYRAFALFYQGRLDEAWQQYEARLDLNELRDANYDRPPWNGEDMAGQPLLLMPEQGMGDNLQFIRYAELAAERGIGVIVITHKPLVRLFQSLKGVAATVNSIPEARHFQRYRSLMSLPLIFGTAPEDIPQNVPYLNAPEELVETWRNKLSKYSGVRVGLCWRGNPKHTNDQFRSSSLVEISGLLDIPGCTFFSLHKDLADFEQELPEDLIDIGSEFEDFADTAAAISSLDLVISVDTSVCHVAGAVGCPTWTMIARGPDFRWGLKADTTLWYPTMKLYRQEILGDWSSVYDRMRSDLEDLAKSAAKKTN